MYIQKKYKKKGNIMPELEQILADKKLSKKIRQINIRLTDTESKKMEYVCDYYKVDKTSLVVSLLENVFNSIKDN